MRRSDIVAKFLDRQPTETQMVAAVRKIEVAFIQFLKRREARKMRFELAKLPYVCRRSFVKMADLKH